jgi:hypothetical protein
LAPERIAPITLEPESWIVLSPPSGHRPALGVSRKQLELLLGLCPTPKPAVEVAREFMAACSVDAAVTLRALQALARVVEAPQRQRSSTPRPMPWGALPPLTTRMGAAE